jgi:hypothetical protein
MVSRDRARATRPEEMMKLLKSVLSGMSAATSEDMSAEKWARMALHDVRRSMVSVTSHASRCLMPRL